MPSMPTHFLFASDLFAELSSRSPGAPLDAAVKAHRDIFMAGAQGPDPFFYYGRAPLKGRGDRRAVSDFGEALHAMDPMAVFPVLAAKASEERGGRRNIAFAYVYGLIAHYVLDRTFHPYVFYRTGFDSSGSLSGVFSVDHSRFETLLGAALLAKRRARAKETGVRPPVLPSHRETAPRRALRVDPDKLGVAGDLWSAAFPASLRPRAYPDAWDDMRSVLTFLWDPFALKRALYAVAGRSNTKSRALIPPRKPPRSDTVDYLNDGAEPWLHPVTGEESVLTAEGLFASAAEDADRVGASLSATFDGGDREPAWRSVLGNITHDGTAVGLRMTRFRSVYGRPQPNL